MINGNIPVEERRRGASSLSLKDAEQCTLSIQLEFLDSCEFTCPGCFVKRRNTFTEKDLIDLNDLASQFNYAGFEMNEIILGPTDLFGCKNVEEIVKHPEFRSLFNHFRALTFPTTLQSDPEHVKRIMTILRKQLPSHIYFEVFVVFHMELFQNNNKEYLARLDENLKELHDANIIFAFNIHEHAFDRISFQEMSKLVNEKYNSHLKMVPSFMRSPNEIKVKHNLNMWKKQMIDSISVNGPGSILDNMSDLNFGGYTYFNYIYKSGHLYASPFIYDFIFEPHPNMEIPRSKYDVYDLDEVLSWEKDNIVKQFKFAENKECNSCEFLPACVGKKVLSYMENHNIMSCFLPKAGMKYQNRIE